MNRRQQRILRQYSDWSVADILIEPDAGISHAKGSQFGASDYTVEGQAFRMQTTGRGIELSLEYGQPPVEILTWAVVAKYARMLPAVVRERLLDARRGLTVSQTSYPTFFATKAAQGCGRPPANGPVTEAQALYAREWQDWHDNRLIPWQERKRQVDLALADAVDEALPLVADGEPLDLVELMTAAGDAA